MAPARAVRSGRCVENGRGGERRKGLSCVASARGCSRREMLLQASRAGAGAALCHGAPPSESFAAAVKVRCFAASWRPAPAPLCCCIKPSALLRRAQTSALTCPKTPPLPAGSASALTPTKPPPSALALCGRTRCCCLATAAGKSRASPTVRLSSNPFCSFLPRLPPHALPPSPQLSLATTASPSAQFSSPRCAFNPERRSASNLLLAPRCDEPTTEVKFASADEGTLSARTLQS